MSIGDKNSYEVTFFEELASIIFRDSVCMEGDEDEFEIQNMDFDALARRSVEAAQALIMELDRVSNLHKRAINRRVRKGDCSSCKVE